MRLNDLKKFAQAARRQLISETTARLDYVLSHDDAYIRAHAAERDEIERLVAKRGRDRLIEEVAYTWFNRIVAFRYMDLRGYHKVRVVSPQAGQVQPELLFQIKQGRTPPEIRSLQGVFDGILNGTIASSQPDREIYTAALLGICNDYSRTLPFLFRAVDEYMAVLLPTDLLSESSIISAVQGAIGDEDVADVEVIGWLYQFYISEKKDEVFGRPNGEKIKKEDIPAATQLFTPHWIVRYMVENSLGRLWRNNRPDTGLAERMEYYIEGDPEPEFLKIDGPEEITLLDPACGSGHILTYAFDLLYGMYEESGYSAEEIPSLILTNNLYGIDIDIRAAELASFALTIKAREKDRFFFKRGVVPRVIAMEDVSVDLREAGITMSPQLQEAFGYLTEATNFGSLIPVPAEVQGEIEELLTELNAKWDADLFADQAIAQVRSGLRQLGYLARRYHCVVTNPPYVDSANLSHGLKGFLTTHHPNTKSNLYSSFIERCGGLASDRGRISMITMDSYMFIPSFANFRRELLSKYQVESLVHLGPHAFDMVTGQVLSTAAFVFRNRPPDGTPVRCKRLVEFSSEAQKRDVFLSSRAEFEFRQESLHVISGVPLAYWMTPDTARAFSECDSLDDLLFSDGLTKTGRDELYIRFWWEIDAAAFRDPNRYRVCVKGGLRRNYYGNLDHVVAWDPKTRAHYRSDKVARITPEYLWERSGVTWTKITSGDPSFRWFGDGMIAETGGPALFVRSDGPSLALADLLAYLNSSVARHFLSHINPTLNFQTNDVLRIPYRTFKLNGSSRVISIAVWDWDSHEESWSFLRSPLMSDFARHETTIAIDDSITRVSWPARKGRSLLLSALCGSYTSHCRALQLECHDLVQEGERVLIELFGLGEEIEPNQSKQDIAILQEEIDKKNDERGAIVFNMKAVMSQLVSYGVGCIFGRYSLDKDGLILANVGDGLDAYLSQIPEPTLRPDESGILPITDDNDFSDDLPSQWRAFLRAAFGDQHYEENLRFLEDGLGKRLRPYFLKGFYDDHVKRYKKRPIYWLITSPKGTLQALIYLHRYNRDTVNRFLNDYLRPYQQKLEAKRVSAEHVLTGGGSSQGEKTKAQKRIDEIRKAVEELLTWERDVVRPLAEKRIELDLDDGVKVNYGKLGAILAKVKGLNG